MLNLITDFEWKKNEEMKKADLELCAKNPKPNQSTKPAAAATATTTHIVCKIYKVRSL